MKPLLSLAISVDYPGKPNALENIGFEIAPAEILGLSGSSGSGKSTIALAILGLLSMRGGRVRGRIEFDGQDLLRCSRSQLRGIRGKEISLVPQNPASSLNPALRLETQLREAWDAHSKESWHSARSAVVALLDRLGLPGEENFLRRYPVQISVGQAQRVVIAMAVLHHPRLIIADEPTSALDAESRHDCLELLRSLNAANGAAILYISHDEDSIQQLCSRVSVLKGGRVIEAIQAPNSREPATCR